MATVEYDQNKQVVSTTDVADIKRYRPDLTDAEAMVLLVENERVMAERYGEKGFDWEDLQEFADMQFPEREVFCLMAPADGDQVVIAAGKLSLRSGEFELINGVPGKVDARHVFVIPSGSSLPASLDFAIAKPIDSFDGIKINSSPFDKAGLLASMAEIYESMPALLEARSEQIDALKYVASVELLKSMLIDRERIFSIIGYDGIYFIGYESGVLTVRDRDAGAVLVATDDESDFLASPIGRAVESGQLKCWDDMSWMLERPANKNLKEFKPKP